MVRYEYKVWYHDTRASALQDQLNEVGRQGWHLQDIIPADGNTPTMLVLTRPYIVEANADLIRVQEEVGGMSAMSDLINYSDPFATQHDHLCRCPLCSGEGEELEIIIED